MPRLERPYFDDLPAAPQHIGAWAYVVLRSPVFWQYMLRLELPLFDD